MTQRGRFAGRVPGGAGERVNCTKCGTWIAVLDNGAPVPRDGLPDGIKFNAPRMRSHFLPDADAVLFTDDDVDAQLPPIVIVAKCRQCGLVHLLHPSEGHVLGTG